MINIRKSQERGHFDFGWLDTFHTFSFDRYYDPRHMGFLSLRVINEDRVSPGRGFPTHSHRDMEIITYIIEGALEHRDSMGNGSVIRPGDVQRMTAGTGVAHSEANRSPTDPVHLLQIWILPEQQGLTPGYEQKFFLEDQKQNKLCLAASHDGRNGSVRVNQDVNLYAGLIDSGSSLTHQLAPNRGVWIQVARGSIDINDHDLSQGDGAAVTDETVLRMTGRESAEILLFDLV